MNVFADMLKEESNITSTENCAVTHKSTLSKVLDFFALGSALRGRKEEEIVKLFELALLEHPIYALKALFYTRDIRGGQGERNSFRILLKHLGNFHPSAIEPYLHLIPEFGRWDDLFAFMGTGLETKSLTLIKDQLYKDLESEKPSLLGKWMPSENTSSRSTIALASKVRKFVEMNSREYRKALSSLRSRIDLVERKMSANQWSDITYSHVPSKAASNYRKAFGKHDQERYADYLKKVEEGKEKINAATLYPYDLTKAYIRGTHARLSGPDATLEAQWKALPNYLNGEDSALVMADVSGSMLWGNASSVLPMDVSISLALYISERVKGPFANTFMTFSATPEIHSLTGKTVYERILELRKTKFGLNTNLQAAFDKLLEVAINTNCSQEDFPKTLFIVSDMEFDTADSNQVSAYSKPGSKSQTNFNVAKAKFEANGYKLPDVVFWNVNSKQDQVPVTKDERGVFLVSGCSPSILKHALNKELVTPMDLMLNVLDSDRYNCIK